MSCNTITTQKTYPWIYLLYNAILYDYKKRGQSRVFNVDYIWDQYGSYLVTKSGTKGINIPSAIRRYLQKLVRMDLVNKIEDGFYALNIFKYMNPTLLLDKRGGNSKSCIEWIKQISEKKKINIQHLENGVEYTIVSRSRGCYKRYKVDGYDATTKTVYEFHGCYWHGCPRCKDLNSFNRKSKSKQTYGSLYEETILRESDIKSLGYTMVIIWECDYNRAKKNNMDFSTFHMSGSIPLPPCPFLDFLVRIEDSDDA